MRTLNTFFESFVPFKKTRLSSSRIAISTFSPYLASPEYFALGSGLSVKIIFDICCARGSSRITVASFS